VFDIQAFLAAAVQLREERIAVPELAAWFPPGADPVWVVRGLTAAELARANAAAADNLSNLRALVSALAGDGSDKTASIRTAFGLSNDDVPGDTSRRIEMLAAGSVQPVLGVENRDVAVKLAEKYAGRFYELTNAIVNLTGQGAEPGKAKRSGLTPA
jgi:hypothetical protein